MPNAAYDYTDFSFVPKSGGANWDAISLPTATTEFSDPMSMQGTVSKIISVVVVVPNLVISGELLISILRKTVTGTYQEPLLDVDNFRRYSIPIEQNQTTNWDITLYAEDLDDFRIYLDNLSGQTLTVSVGEDSSSITPAS
jgi:hypothetical protein